MSKFIKFPGPIPNYGAVSNATPLVLLLLSVGDWTQLVGLGGAHTVPF